MLSMHESLRERVECRVYICSCMKHTVTIWVDLKMLSCTGSGVYSGLGRCMLSKPYSKGNE